MCSKSGAFKCEHCDYVSSRKYNFSRHMVTHSVTPNVVSPTPNVVSPTPNVVSATPKVVSATPNVVPKNQTDLANRTCEKCYKVLSRTWTKNKHEAKCKGVVNSLQCSYCQETFSCRSNTSRHLRTCKAKREADSTALVCVVPPVLEAAEEAAAPQQIQQIANIETQNNSTINSHNQTTTNNIINLVVYNDNKSENMSFNTDHIDVEDLKERIRVGSTFNHPDKMTEVIKHYTKQIMSVPTNLCVKKTNLRSSHSKVHVGNNNWESRQDCDVYPHMMNNIANDFSEFICEKYNRRVYQIINKFAQYMASDGYCADDDKTKHVKDCYNALVRELKLMTHDFTKQFATAAATPSRAPDLPRDMVATAVAV